MSTLSDLAADLRVSPFVHLLGSRRDVSDVLNAFDAFVLCSDLEGHPLAITEAMATALPVISTRVGGIPNVIEDGVTGFLVPPGAEEALRDRIAMLRADPELGRACGSRARTAAVTRFSAERMRREYVELYEHILSRRSRPAAPRGAAWSPSNPG